MNRTSLRSSLMLCSALILSACTAPAPEAEPTATAVPSTAPPGAASGPAPARSHEPEGQPGGALVVWAHGDLPPSFADELALRPEITAATHVLGTTLGLTGARDADGRVVTSLADGFRVPVGVVVVDPDGYVATLDADAEATRSFAALQPGTVLLTDSGAALRGVGVGGRLDIGAAHGLEIVGVVPDGLAARAEVVAHAADAVSLGLGPDGTVFLRHRATDDDARRQLIADVEAAVPEGITARVVDVDSRGDRRRAPLVLSLQQVKQRFGEFTFRPRPGERAVDLAPGFVERHITTAPVPLLGDVTCHRDIIEDLRAALAEVRDAGLAGEVDPDRYAGCFSPRRISVDGDRLSHHAWGIALDINVDLSAPGGGEVPHPEVIAAFERHGFRWGGDFIVPDNHHFEWVGTSVDERGSRP